MLNYLKLVNVGPAPEMEMELKPRLNIITGDNGLGKSFLLDTAWWALTRKWPHEINGQLTSGYVAKPTDPSTKATISFAVETKTRKNAEYTSDYNPRNEGWLGMAGRPWNPGLVIYAHADGGFSVWDPARNYWKTKGDMDTQDRIPCYVFSPKEVWDGLEAVVDNRKTIICNGLILDWASWINRNGEDAKQMASVLEVLSAGTDEDDKLSPGELTRISLDDVRDIPTVCMPYAKDVPILYASAGVRRMVALAYMLLWSRKEHVIASKLLGEDPTDKVVLLVDEIEGHLHPRWQRTILRALLDVVKQMHEQATVQLIATTHSPLVLSSVETLYDDEIDSWFDLDLDRQGDAATVTLSHRPFVRLGDASRWLMSEAFDLKSARSIEAECVIERASLLLASDSFDRRDAIALDEELRDVLGDTDPFWSRWRYVGEKKGWL